MGYSAHRAWSAGVMANDATTFDLAKVLEERVLISFCARAHLISARRYTLLDTTWAQFDMDAALLWT